MVERKRPPPTQRGFAQVYLQIAMKRELQEAAAAGGHTTVQDYIMWLHRQHQQRTQQ